MSAHTRSPRLGLGLLTLVLAFAPATLGLADRPTRPGVSRSLYLPTKPGFQHFLQDTLNELVKSQSWTWQGQTYECRKLHKVERTEITRHENAQASYGTAVRAWTISVVHVRVDGRLMRARVVGNAGYSSSPAGWYWEEILLTLGNGDHYDFVLKKVV